MPNTQLTGQVKSLDILHTILTFCELSGNLSVILLKDTFAFFFIFLKKCYVSWTEHMISRNKQTLKELIFRHKNPKI